MHDLGPTISIALVVARPVVRDHQIQELTAKLDKLTELLQSSFPTSSATPAACDASDFQCMNCDESGCTAWYAKGGKTATAPDCTKYKCTECDGDDCKNFSPAVQQDLATHVDGVTSKSATPSIGDPKGDIDDWSNPDIKDAGTHFVPPGLQKHKKFHTNQKLHTKRKEKEEEQLQ